MSLPIKRARLETPAHARLPPRSTAAVAAVAPPQLVLGAHSRGVPRTVWECVASWLQFRDVGRLQSVARDVGPGASAAFAAASHLTIAHSAALGGSRGDALCRTAAGGWGLTCALATAPRGSPVAAHARLRHLTVGAGVHLNSLAAVELVLLIMRCRATLRSLRIDCSCTSHLLRPALRECAQLETLHLATGHTFETDSRDAAWVVSPRLRALSGNAKGSGAPGKLVDKSLLPLYVAGRRLTAVYGAIACDDDHLARHPVRCLDIVYFTPALAARLYLTLESLEIGSYMPGMESSVDLSPRVWRLVTHYDAIRMVRRAPGLRALSAYIGRGGGGSDANEAALVRVLASASAAANLQVLRLVTHYRTDAAGAAVYSRVSIIVHIASLTPGLRVFTAQVLSRSHGHTLSALAAARCWPALRSLHLFPWSATPPAVGRSPRDRFDENEPSDAAADPADTTGDAGRVTFDLAAALHAWPRLQCLQLTVRDCVGECESARCVDPRSNEGNGWAQHNVADLPFSTDAAAAAPADTATATAGTATATADTAAEVAAGSRPASEATAGSAAATGTPCAAGSHLRCLVLSRGIDCSAALPALPALRSFTVYSYCSRVKVAAISWAGILRILRAAPGILNLQLYLHDALRVAPSPPMPAIAGDRLAAAAPGALTDTAAGSAVDSAADATTLRLSELRHIVCNVKADDLPVCTALVCGAPQVRSLHCVSEGLLRSLSFAGADVLPLLESITFKEDVLADTLIYWARSAPRFASLLY